MKKMIILLMMLLLIIPFKVKAIYATSAIVMDMNSKRVLYSRNIHHVRSVASISKVMTAILAIESEKIYDEVTIGAEINDSYGSGIYIKETEQLVLLDLVYGLMLRSGNDAALAIATYVAGNVDDFVVLMNKKAKELGMENTTFNNPHGLETPKGNYSSAYDMALLTSYAMENATYQKVVRTKNYTLKTNLSYYDWHNKNKLLVMYRYATGGKTGFTEIAKRTLITTATKDNLNLVAVTLNDGNDFSDHITLFEEAFNNYQNYVILKPDFINVIDEKYYQNGFLYIDKQYSYPLALNEVDSIVLKFELNKNSKYKSADQVGLVKVYLADQEIYKDNVYVKLKKEISWFTKLKMWFGKLW